MIEFSFFEKRFLGAQTGFTFATVAEDVLERLIALSLCPQSWDCRTGPSLTLGCLSSLSRSQGFLQVGAPHPVSCVGGDVFLSESLPATARLERQNEQTNLIYLFD